MNLSAAIQNYTFRPYLYLYLYIKDVSVNNSLSRHVIFIMFPFCIP